MAGVVPEKMAHLECLEQPLSGVMVVPEVFKSRRSSKRTSIAVSNKVPEMRPAKKRKLCEKLSKIESAARLLIAAERILRGVDK